jgi:pimeloyl-ACP methyl ester carboxylesterase
MVRLLTRALALLALHCVALAAAVQATAACSLTTRSEKIGQGTIVYNSVGSGPQVLLIHGLFANKEQWNELACRLAESGFTAIAVDLPGYGKSEGFALSDYALESQVAKLRALTMRLDIRQIELAGNSMGGTIMARYASRYPRQVRSIAFIGSPLGIIGWNSGIRDAIRKGINPFVPVSEQQLDLELKLLFVNPPLIPEAEKRDIVADFVRHNRHYVQVWNIVSLYHDVLRHNPPPAIRTLVIWGEQDQVFDVAGAQSLQGGVPAAEVHLLPRAGHLLHIENAAEVAPLYTDFLKRTQAMRESPAPASKSIAAVFDCEGGKTVKAVFENAAQSLVKLALSDGRELTLPQVRSGSGARYADARESFVFWNKGDTAFIEERGRVTYRECNARR